MELPTFSTARNNSSSLTPRCRHRYFTWSTSLMSMRPRSGNVLYAKSLPAVREKEWAALVQIVAAGNQLALHALYERAHRPVFHFDVRSHG